MSNDLPGNDLPGNDLPGNDPSSAVVERLRFIPRHSPHIGTIQELRNQWVDYFHIMKPYENILINSGYPPDWLSFLRGEVMVCMAFCDFYASQLAKGLTSADILIYPDGITTHSTAPRARAAWWLLTFPDSDKAWSDYEVELT
jgi:hypothetical protein